MLKKKSGNAIVAVVALLAVPILVIVGFVVYGNMKEAQTSTHQNR